MKAADHLRGYDVQLAGAMRWVSRRVRLVHHVLSVVIGLLPQLAGCRAELTACRARLGQRCGAGAAALDDRWLATLAAPLGFRPHGITGGNPNFGRQHHPGLRPGRRRIALLQRQGRRPAITEEDRMNHREPDHHHDAEEKLRREVALFRYRLIGDLAQAPPGTPGIKAQLRATAEQQYTIPGTLRTRVAARPCATGCSSTGAAASMLCTPSGAPTSVGPGGWRPKSPSC